MTEGDTVRAAVALGANLDNPPAQLREALAATGRLPATRLLRCSRFYRTPPMGPPQPDYCNAVCLLATKLAPPALLAALKGIERAQGRDPAAPRWSARRIDLDLLVHGATVCRDEAGLQLPHPGIAERDFVILPLAEVAPELEIPGLGRADVLARRYAADALTVWPELP